jgi:hypothetical protein
LYRRIYEFKKGYWPEVGKGWEWWSACRFPQDSE